MVAERPLGDTPKQKKVIVTEARLVPAQCVVAQHPLGDTSKQNKTEIVTEARIVPVNVWLLNTLWETHLNRTRQE